MRAQMTDGEPREAPMPVRVGWSIEGGSDLDRPPEGDYLFMTSGAKGAPPARQGRPRMIRKASAAAAVVAFATVGSALFGGAALANGDHNGNGNGEDPEVTFTGGAGGAGGTGGAGGEA